MVLGFWGLWIGLDNNVLAEDGGLLQVSSYCPPDHSETFLLYELLFIQGFYLNHVLPPKPSKSYRVISTASYIVAQLATLMFSLSLST